jgi:hypothetical protein
MKSFSSRRLTVISGSEESMNLAGQLQFCLFLGVLSMALAGCAFGNHGTLVARRTIARGAEVIDTFAFGALVRPIGADSGISFGYRHASYIYPLDPAKAAEEPRTQWYWFHAPPALQRPLLRASTSIGLETQFTPEIRRCTLGYLSQMLTIGGSPHESKIVKLHYARRYPLETTLEYRED